MGQIKLIILDFDGTLADTRTANSRAYVAALAEEGIALSEEEYLARFFGKRCSEFLTEMGITDPAAADRIRRRKIELYPTFFDSVRLNRPLWEFCQSFRAQGTAVWIASTGQPDNLRNAMRHLGLESGIDGIIDGSGVCESKPSPECFLTVMERVGATPAETIIFEDSPVGLEAARRSGAAYFKVKL